MNLPSLCRQKRDSGDMAYVRINGTKIYCGPWGSSQAMVRLQRLTGMRPGEVRQMRACDIDCSFEEWIYIPWEHKTEHHGLPRMICLEPRCQAILTYRMDRENEPQRWLFSPNEAMAERHAKARERCKTKVQPSVEKIGDLNQVCHIFLTLGSLFCIGEPGA